jgi:flagellar biosynthesis GTPase FlhF
MSETLMAAAPIAGAEPTKTYRGASIEELLPRIRADLGPEAVIVSRREGLIGGFAGFFQKRCIEIDARPGGPRIDVYDDGDAGDGEPAMETAPEPQAEGAPEPEPEITTAPTAYPVRNDAATREGLGTPTMQRLVGEAKPFADLLDEVAVEPPEAAEAAPEPRRVATLREGMVGAGLGVDLATEVIDAVVASVAPFATPSRLRTLVRNELALRLPIAPAPGPGRRRLAVVGPAGTGKTAAVARVAAAHAAAGQEVACLTLEPADGGASLRALLEGSGIGVEAIGCQELAVALLGESAQLVLIDTPAAAPSNPAAVESLGATLRVAALDEIHLAVRAGTASPAAVEMQDKLKSLDPNRILVSSAADTSYIGAALDVAIRTSLPIHYVAETVVDLAPADPRGLASRVVP